MTGIRGLIYILALGFLILSLSVALMEWADIVRLRALVEQTEKELSLKLLGTIKEAIQVRETTDEYQLFDLAKRHGIRRIILFNENAEVLNDTASGEPSAKFLPPKEEVLSAIAGNERFVVLRYEGKRLGISLGRTIHSGKPLAVAVFLELSQGTEGTETAVFTLLAGGALLFAVLLYTALRAYGRHQRQDTEETTEMGFVVDTFHGLVNALKEKEKELEALRGLAEERAERIEDYNENILQSVTSGVITLDSTGRITKINSAGEAILGLKSAEILGKTAEALSGTIAELLLSSPSVERGELEYRSASGRRLWLGFNLVPLLDKHKTPIGRLFVFTDLTELKALEAQAALRQRLSSLGEMAAGIAHELRNPMAVIAGYAKLLSRQIKGEPLKTVEAISREIAMMDKVINDFLSFARPEKPRFEPVPLRALIEETAKSLIAEKPVSLSIDIEGSLTLEADPVLLRQTFANLLQNSVEAMPEGGEISIKASAEADLLRIVFSDTGHGIPEAVADRIFLPFFTTKERGTGLGLAIVHRNITQLGGSIELLSSKETGTEFLITLPLKQAVL